jgi:predicted metal-dependent HD superfamily phosphohydrolase
MLKETYLELLSYYTKNKSLINELWSEIEQKYSGKRKHYHNLQHLENLLQQLIEVKDKIQNWNIILFTLFYHDSIYNTLKTNNEEKSADLAEKRMKQLGVYINEIELCKEQILATKSHQLSTNNDTNLFTDADLSILGQPWETYVKYLKNVRKEYKFYPIFVYKLGRKNVIQHFLEMKPLFKTKFFFDKFENQAKKNLLKELSTL